MTTSLSDEKKVGLGNVLKLLRIANEMSTKDLATKMGVSSTYISEVEGNNKNPSLDMLSKYSEALNVSKSAIMYFDEEGSKHGYAYKKLLLKILQELTKES
jgi:Predicted transcriptional regulator